MIDGVCRSNGWLLSIDAAVDAINGSTWEFRLRWDGVGRRRSVNADAIDRARLGAAELTSICAQLAHIDTQIAAKPDFAALNAMSYAAVLTMNVATIYLPI